MAIQKTKNKLTKRDISQATNRIALQLDAKIKKKGYVPWNSTHEIYGKIAEEFNRELLMAMHLNNDVEFESELVDIAVCAIFGLASMSVIKKAK